MANPKKTIIFDFDGTLANSTELILDLLNSHTTMFGYDPIDRSEIPALRRMGYKKAMKAKRVKLRLVPSMILTLGKKMRERINEVQPFDGIVDVLQTLKNDGFELGVLTSNQVPLVQKFFDDHAFPQFDFIVSEKALFGKAKALKRLMKKYQIAREQVVYVGDEPRDVVASRKAKVAVIGVSWGLGGIEGFELAPPDTIVTTPSELLQQLRS